MIEWMKEKYNNFVYPLPRGTTNFHGNMDAYRMAVNANATNDWRDSKEIQEFIEALQTDNKNQTETIIEQKHKIEKLEAMIRELENDKMDMSMNSPPPTSDYDTEMKGFVL